jgi:hypothetical protein
MKNEAIMDSTTFTMEKQKHSHHYSDKPPYAERHVWWCERTDRELIPTFLPDLLFVGVILKTFLRRRQLCLAKKI